MGVKRRAVTLHNDIGNQVRLPAGIDVSRASTL